MQITTQTDYALRLLVYLRAHPDQVVTLPEVAAAYDISLNHLVKVGQKLTQLGYTHSQRGRGGGMTLLMPAEEINIGKVVRQVEPSLNIVECFDDATNTCPITSACNLKHALKKATDAFMDVLDQYTLADMAKDRKRLAQLWLNGQPR